MDITQLLPEHQQTMSDIINDKFGIGYTDEHKQRLYEVYLKLASIPTEDWNKPTIQQELQD